MTSFIISIVDKLQCKVIHSQPYYMATIVRALIGCLFQWPGITSQVSKAYTICVFKHETWWWTSMLWSIDRCQKRLSADQCHMTAQRAERDYSSRWRAFIKLSADQLLVLIRSRSKIRARVQNFSLSKKLSRGFNHIARFVLVQWSRPRQAL